MAVRSARLWGVNALDLAGSWVNVAQVPAGERWLVKEVALRHSGASPVVVFMRSAVDRHWFAEELPITVMRVYPRWTILDSGAQVAMFAPAASQLRGVVSGTRFVL